MHWPIYKLEFKYREEFTWYYWIKSEINFTSENEAFLQYEAFGDANYRSKKIKYLYLLGKIVFLICDWGPAKVIFVNVMLWTSKGGIQTKNIIASIIGYMWAADS